MRSWLSPLLFGLGLAALLFIPACSEDDDEETGETTPPTPVLTSNVRLLNTTSAFGGAFPSDMVIGGTSGTLATTLFVNDDATIDAGGGAQILALDLTAADLSDSASYATFTLNKTDLLKDDGSAVGSADGFGSFSSDPTTDALLVVDDTTGFVLSSAGLGEDWSGGTATTGLVACVTLFNPTTGTHTQTINLGLDVTATGHTMSDGSSITGTIRQSNPSGVAWVSTGAATGKLYVSMSNLVSWPWGSPPLYNPGTVQVFNVDLSAGTPITATPSATIFTTAFNPVHVTTYTSAATTTSWVLASCAGATAYTGPPYTFVSHTNSAIDVLNTANDTVRTSIDMGLAALSFHAVAITTDGTGKTVGLVGSNFYGNIYAVQLSGLDQNPEVVADVKALRTAYNPIVVFSSDQGDKATWAADVAVSADGTCAFVTAYNQGQVHVVNCPDDWSTGEFVAHPAGAALPLDLEPNPAGVTGSLAYADRILLRPDGGTPELFVLQSTAVPFGSTPNGNECAAVATIDAKGRMK